MRVKLSLILTVVTVSVMGALGLLVARNIQETAADQAIWSLRNENRLVVDLIASTSEVLKLEADRLGRAFEARFPGVFRIESGTTILLDGRPTPALRHDGMLLNGNHQLVDAFSHDTGGHVATVFARRGDDFIRVSTSLTDTAGRRAVATVLERTHPGYARLMHGEPYLGQARLFGRYYMTKYWPIKDRAGSVIGALFIGMNLTDSLAALKDKIRPVRNNKAGYVTIIDAASGPSYGTYVLHPAREGRNELVDGAPAARLLVKDVLDRRQGTLSYEWINTELHETEPRQKLAEFSEFKDWQWIVISTTYVDEFMGQANHLQRLFAAGILLTTVAIILGLNLAIGRLVVSPLLRLQEGLERTHQDLRRLNRMYRVLTACNESFNRANSEQALLDSICAHLIGIGNYRLAWVAFAEADAARTVRPVAHAGVDDGYLEAVHVSWAANEHEQDPTGTAIRERHPTVARHLPGDPRYAAGREAALRHGCVSSIALPLMPDDAVCFGALSICAVEADAFDADEQHLLIELANDLAHGIQTLRDRKARDQAQLALQESEQALRESEARHRTVLAALGEGVYGMDRDGRCTFINRAAVAMLGLAEEDVVGQDQHALFHHHRADGQAYPHAECPIQMTAHDGQFRQEEEWFFRADGSGFPVDLVVTPLMAADQRTGAVVAFRDISTRRRAEEQLLKLSLAVEQSPESIVITGLDARIEYVNEAFLRTTGYLREEVIGKNPRILQSGKTPAATYADQWEALTQGRPWKGEFVNRRKDGSDYIELAIITPIRQSDGRTTHYVAIKEDITERKRIAAELDQHRHHLEELVVDRTVQLARASERAELASRAKGEFLANMSHEIRTPLNGVLGLAQIGYRDSFGRKAQVTFGHILDTGKLLLGIINDILDFSKIEAGKLKIEAVPLAPGAIVDHAVALMQERARDKGLAVAVDKAAALPARCLGDPLRIEQVLMNLLANAVKFTERGSIVVSARRDGDVLAFTVADTGIGMNAEQVARLFTPFEQADGSTTRRFGGTGLGLAISKRLVELMGGEIRVQSQAARGSQFEMRLPLIEAPLTPGEPAEQPGTSIATPSGPRLAGISILVAEDTEINQLVLDEFLTSEGAQVVMVADGQQAVDRVTREGADTFDIVLMDIQMPVMGGYEATRRIGKLAPRLPIVGQSAHAMAEEREECMAAGMVDHLAKPIDIDELVAVVLRHAAN